MSASTRLNPVCGSDEPLEQLARLAAGDEAAFERLVRRCYERIHRWAVAATGDADEADDVAQETLLRMHRSLVDFRGDCHFESWIYRITSSVAADLNRKRAGRVRKLLRVLRFRDVDHQEPPAVLGRIDAERKLDLLRGFWAQLPPGQRQVFDLADLQGYTPNEIAEMLEINPTTVRAHLFKARRSIRTKMLESEMPHEEGFR